MLNILWVTFPFFALVVCGFLAARRRLLPLDAIGGLNGFVLFFALPCMLFRFGSTTPIAQLLDGAVFGVYLLCAMVIVAFTVAMTLNKRIRWNDAAMGALVAAFPNTGFMGVPLLATLLGPRSAGPVIVMIVVDMVVTSSLCIALSRLDGAGGGAKGAMDAVRKALKGIAANPMPWAIVLGGAASAADVSLPGPIQKTAWLLADAASPVALFTIGAVLARAQMTVDHPSTPQRLRARGADEAAAAPGVGGGGGGIGHSAGCAVGPFFADLHGAGGCAAKRQQRVAAGRAVWGRQRAHCPHHPGVHRSGVCHVFGGGGQ